VSEKLLCLGCFESEQSAEDCICGFKKESPRPALYLPLGTKLIDRYIVGRALGKPGGFGNTYLCFDEILDKSFAIKEYFPKNLVGRAHNHPTISPHSEEDESLFNHGLKQFLDEARKLAKFDHSNIIGVKNFFESLGTCYMVMDYHKGGTLQEYLNQNGGKISESLAIRSMVPILDGLNEVHRKGILHRDIKPENIYVTLQGRPILLDFGAARVELGERSGHLGALLTPGFAPPEQYFSKVQGIWTDIYSCGATLYYLVTGKVPQDGLERKDKDNLIEPCRLDPSISEAFSQAVMRALKISPDHRFKTIKELQDQLLISTPLGPTPTQPIDPPMERCACGKLKPQGELCPVCKSPEVPVTDPKKKNNSKRSLVLLGVLILVGLFFVLEPTKDPFPTSSPKKSESSTKDAGDPKTAMAPEKGASENKAPLKAAVETAATEIPRKETDGPEPRAKQPEEVVEEPNETEEPTHVEEEVAKEEVVSIPTEQPEEVVEEPNETEEPTHVEEEVAKEEVVLIPTEQPEEVVEEPNETEEPTHVEEEVAKEEVVSIPTEQPEEVVEEPNETEEPTHVEEEVAKEEVVSIPTEQPEEVVEEPNEIEEPTHVEEEVAKEEVVSIPTEQPEEVVEEPNETEEPTHVEEEVAKVKVVSIPPPISPPSIPGEKEQLVESIILALVYLTEIEGSILKINTIKKIREEAGATNSTDPDYYKYGENLIAENEQIISTKLNEYLNEILNLAEVDENIINVSIKKFLKQSSQETNLIELAAELFQSHIEKVEELSSKKELLREIKNYLFDNYRG
jgi:serine/threonine protein kinase